MIYGHNFLKGCGIVMKLPEIIENRPSKRSIKFEINDTTRKNNVKF